jgi:drug/metabolite transporter (DMT)-like permease
MDSSAPRPASAAAIWTGMVVLYFVWGSTYLGMRFAIESMPPFLMASARFLISGIVLYAWRMQRGDPPPTRAHWKSAAVIGLFLLLGGNGGVVWAEQRIPSGIAALLVGAVPLWFVILDALLRRFAPRWATTRSLPGWVTLVGLAAGFAGIVLLISPTDLAGLGGSIDLLGGVVVVLAALSWSAGSLFSRTAVLPASPLLSPAMEMIVGGAALALLGTLSGEWSRVDLAAITARSWAGLGYLVIFGSLVGYVTYTWLLRAAPTTLVSTYAYVNPVVAILVGNLLAQEPLTPRVVISALVILGSVVVINARRPKPKTRPLDLNPSSEFQDAQTK